jgi:hypothetical protein
MSTMERIQSEGAGLCADGQQMLYRVECQSSGLKRESMAESLKKMNKQHINPALNHRTVLINLNKNLWHCKG